MAASSSLFRALGVLALAVGCCQATASEPAGSASAAAGEQEQILQWRERRDQGLRREDSWLTLVGLEWLQQGANRIGSGAGNDIRLPGGPEFWGTIDLAGDSLHFTRAQGTDVTVDEATPEQAELVADNQGEPTVIRSGSLSFYVIFRESYALRVKDTQAPALLHFGGVENYEIQPDWKIEGQLIPAAEGETIEIANVLGQVSPTPVYGVFEFERDGNTYRLIGLGEEDSDSLWFIFADRTNGHGTYGAGRFLYSEGLPSGGRLVVDFNKSYNPPCAFSEFATCPLPPPENRLDLAITAGEKDFHPHTEID